MFLERIVILSFLDYCCVQHVYYLARVFGFWNTLLPDFWLKHYFRNAIFILIFYIKMINTYDRGDIIFFISNGEGGWKIQESLDIMLIFVLEPMQLASGCMWIWFADSIPALVGILRALQFPPTPKNRNPLTFMVHSFWSSRCVYKAWLSAWGWITYVCAAAVTQRRLENPVAWCRALQKLQVIISITLRA